MRVLWGGVKTCVKYIVRPHFRKYIEKYNQPISLCFEERGELWKGHIVYLISMEDLEGMESHMGFFALLNCVLNRLSYADRLGFIPVVHYPITVLYYDSNLDYITSNVFEYFFEPVSTLTYEDTKIVQNLVISKEADSQFLLKYKPGYLLDNSGILRLSEIWLKYIHFNKETKIKLNKDIKLITLAKKVLGVHIRGTDFKNINKNHPVAISIEQYIKQAKEIFESGNYSHIFIATDEMDAIYKLSSAFDKKTILFYTDVLRSDNGEPLHKTENCRKMHKYLLGYEVLRDMITLANCDGFIAGKSQVSLAVQIYNGTLKKRFEDLCILDNGIY